MAGSDCEGHRRRRFQPFKKLQKLFRRKGKAGDDDDPSEASALPEAPPSPQAQRRRTSGKSASSPNKYRLSMSHDSIFQTGGDSTAGMDSAASIPSLPSSSSRLAAELRSVLTKKRGDGDDDDSGLPRSPASPPDGPLHTGKTQTGKSGGSCSDGSMLSIYSSGTGTGTDDDIFGPLSENSSRLSLSRDQDSLELRPAGALSHAAAKHRIAVRPRRNHGGSRPRRPGRPGATPASVPATVEEEGSEHPAATAEKTETSTDQGLPAEGPARGRATLPATGVAVAERATPVQRSRSTIADRRLRDLSPRKLWGRDSSEPAPAATEKKSEGFFSRLFGSRRSGRKRKTGSKDSEDTPRGSSRRDASQEDREEARDEADAPVGRAPESLPARPLAAAEGVEASSPTEVVSEPDVVDSAHSALEKERKESAAALAREMRAVGLLAAKKQSLERSEEDAAQTTPREDETRQEERGQRSPEVTARPRSILRTGSRSASQGSEGAEPAKPAPQTPSESEPQSLESISDHEVPTAAAAEHKQPEEQEWEEKEPDDQKSQEQQQEGEDEESPPVLRRRRATPERTEEQHMSQVSRSSSGQKLSWMEELRRSPPRDGSTGHDPRRTYVKEAARTSSSGDEDTQRTPSWVKEEPRKSPQSSQHELRKTWIKETPKTPPSSEEDKLTPPWVKDEMRKSSPPPVDEEEPAMTPPWITEELQRASMPPGDPTSGVPLRPARARPGRRPASSADPTLPVSSPAAGAGAGATSGYRAPGPSPPTGVDKRRRASALVFGGAEPVSPLDSGPRSLDSAVLLMADPVEPAIRRRPAPAADPAVSTADGSRIAAGAEEAAAGSPSGSSDRLSSAGSEAEGERASSPSSEGRQSAEGVSRSASSESVGEIAGEAGEALAEVSDREESSGRPGSATSGTASDQTGSRKSLAESIGSSPSDSGQCDELNTPDEDISPPVSSLTPDRPEVPAKPRKVSETEPTTTPPSTPTQDGARLSPLERTPSSETADVTPEFMKIHLHHRAETPSGMTTQVVVPKPKTRETSLKPTGQTEARESKVEAKPETKPEAKPESEFKKHDKVETKPDHKFDGLASDIPEVVLIEKHHSPRQSRSSVQSFHEDQTTVDVKPSSAAAPVAAPKSPKPAPEVPARPSVLSAVKTPDFSARTPDSSRHSSLGRQSTQESDESEPVVLRRRPPPPAAAAAASTSPDSELLKVFKRRSLKTVSSEESAPKLSTPTTPVPATATEDAPSRQSQEEVPRPRTSVVTAPAPASPPESRPSWSQRSISMPAGGPKSPPVRETGPPSIGAVPTEAASVPARPERPRKPAPPPTQPRPAPPVAAAVSVPAATAAEAITPVTADPPRVKSTTDAARALSAASAAAGPSGEQRRSAQGAEEEAAPTADWLKLVRERREQREQREQQTMRKLGHKELIIEPDTLAPARTPAPRSSRVLEMASTFQKLQPT